MNSATAQEYRLFEKYNPAMWSLLCVVRESRENALMNDMQMVLDQSQFIKQFCLLQLQAPRRSGKTTFILNHANKDLDLVVVPDNMLSFWKKEWLRAEPSKNLVSVTKFLDPNFDTRLGRDDLDQPVNHIWFDSVNLHAIDPLVNIALSKNYQFPPPILIFLS